MASPHASSFICLPYSNQSDIVLAHTVYFGTCVWSALIGVLGALLFLFQVVRSTHEPGISNSQKWILVMLALSDLLADIGECWCMVQSGCNGGSLSNHPVTVGVPL